jgi:prevent-host-death family protein
MIKVSIARLKVELSCYLDAVKHGEAVVIVERGRPIAKLVAVDAPERVESRRERLARTGMLAFGSRRLRSVLQRAPGGSHAGGDVRALPEERAEGR